MSNFIKVRQDATGRLDQVEIFEQRRSVLKAQYAYIADGLVIDIKGKKGKIPTTSELLALIDAKFSEYQNNLNVPNISFFNNTLAAGNVTQVMWPAMPEKSFKLLGLFMSIGANSVTSVNPTKIYIQDGGVAAVPPAVNIVAWNLNATAAAYTLAAPIVFSCDFTPNGYVSIGQNRGLWIVLDNALTVGDIICITWGVAV